MSPSTRWLGFMLLTLASGCGRNNTAKPNMCDDGAVSGCFGSGNCRGTQRCEDGAWTTCSCDGAGGAGGGALESGGGGGAAASSSEGGGTSPGGSGTAGETAMSSAGASNGGSGGGATGGTSAGGSDGAGGSGGSGADGSGAGGSGGAGAESSGGSGGESTGGSGGASGGSCTGGESRCTVAGRETCEDGAWASDPCPLDTPACAMGTCVLRGPEMVRVSGFYVDSTEVTVEQYEAFLAAKGDDTAGQPAVCEWNTAFWDGSALNPGDWPMTGVDWCDARAFCDWAGKRLCGSQEGGPIARADLFDQTKSQWFLACGGPNGLPHPGSGDCNASGGLEDVASYPECEGFYSGLFDMEGNAAEWVDSCDSNNGAEDDCYLVGGSYVNNAFCDGVPAMYPRNHIANPFGFRCCSG